MTTPTPGGPNAGGPRPVGPVTVGAVMTEPAITAEPTETLEAAAHRMSEHRIGALVVVEAGRPVGIITERDLLRATAAAADPNAALVRDWMVADPECVDTDTSLDQAWRQLADRGYRHIPVVVGDDLKGIISMRDLMARTQLRPADELAVTAPPGLKGVVVAETALGDVRGTEGFYHYRQYAATDLAATRTFEDVWHLLLDGELPTLAERAEFVAEVAPLRTLPDAVLAALPDIARNTPAPVAALRTAISLLAGVEDLPASLDVDRAELRRQALRLERVGAHAHRRHPPPSCGSRPDRASRRSPLRSQLPLHDRRLRARPCARSRHRAVHDAGRRPRLQRGRRSWPAWLPPPAPTWGPWSSPRWARSPDRCTAVHPAGPSTRSTPLGTPTTPPHGFVRRSPTAIASWGSAIPSIAPPIRAR